MTDRSRGPVARRTLLARIAAGAALVGFGAERAEAQAPAATRGFQPARHAQDDWFDQVPGRHRFFLDAVSATGAGEAILFAKNFFNANKSGYDLVPSDLAVVICLRHHATPLAFNDTIWAKYGPALAEAIKLDTGGRIPLANPHAAGFADLVSRGVHFAICDMATHHFAEVVAGKTNTTSEAVYREMVAATHPHAHLAPAGIVAVNRAQERGYTFAYVG